MRCEMEGFTTKERLMKRLITAAALALGLTLLGGCKEKKPEPEELLAEYMTLLNEEKYDEMYDYLTEEAKTAIQRETYVERYENIYGGIEAVNIQADIEERKEGHKDKKAVTQRVILPEIFFQIVLQVSEHSTAAHIVSIDDCMQIGQIVLVAALDENTACTILFLLESVCQVIGIVTCV